ERERERDLSSDEYLSLRGPRNAPVIKEAVRWKFTPMGWDAIPQTWYTGLTNSHNRDAWYTITEPLGRETYHRWQRSNTKKEKAIPPGYALHLRDSSWYDPIIPPQYSDPNTRWSAFLWKDKNIPGKEYGKKQDYGDEGMRGKTQAGWLHQRLVIWFVSAQGETSILTLYAFPPILEKKWIIQWAPSLTPLRGTSRCFDTTASPNS
uniref:Tektin bundle interacting protein 1 n=1 Tax=Pseudonaja textilis TaxID=8673 RepID=A0A670XUZ2_PSETE